MATLKDSGDRREFDTGAVRDMAEGKGRMDLVPWDIAYDINEHLMAIEDDPASIRSVLYKFAVIESILNHENGLINAHRVQALKTAYIMAAAEWIKYYYSDRLVHEPELLDENVKTKDAVRADVSPSPNALFASAMLDVSKHFEDGAKKYSDNNWRKGIPVNFYFDSASRHLMKRLLYWNDEPHHRAVLWNLMCGAWTAQEMYLKMPPTETVTVETDHIVNNFQDLSNINRNVYG